MNFPDWVAARKGRATEVAAHFGVSLSAVSQWLKNGVPIDRMKSVRDLSGGEVSLEDLLPASQMPVHAAAAASSTIDQAQPEVANAA